MVSHIHSSLCGDDESGQKLGSKLSRNSIGFFLELCEDIINSRMPDNTSVLSVVMEALATTKIYNRHRAPSTSPALQDDMKAKMGVANLNVIYEKAEEIVGSISNDVIGVQNAIRSRCQEFRFLDEYLRVWGDPVTIDFGDEESLVKQVGLPAAAYCAAKLRELEPMLEEIYGLSLEGMGIWGKRDGF